MSHESSLESRDLRMAYFMTGEEYFYDLNLLEAARFMSNRNDPDPELKLQGQLIYEDDQIFATLFAFGIRTY